MARSMALDRLGFGLLAMAATLVLAVHIAHIGSHHVSELLVMHSVSLPGGWNTVMHTSYGLESPVQRKVAELKREISAQ
jgi:hypothetical protein